MTHHENIVRVTAFSEGDLQHPPCLVMERMAESLFHFLRTDTTRPSLVERLEIIKDISEVLFRTSPRKLRPNFTRGPGAEMDILAGRPQCLSYVTIDETQVCMSRQHDEETNARAVKL